MMENPMECKEFEKLTSKFIEGKLDYLTLKRFKEHYDTCKECQEELAIQFLVAEGLLRLEEGSAFDLQNELSGQIEEASRKINFNRGFLEIGMALQIVAFVLIGLGVVWIIFN